MKNIMRRIHQMTETLQLPELNIVDAMTIIRAQLSCWRKLRDDHDTMNQEIDADITFLRKDGNNDPEEEFQRKQWMRKTQIQFEPNQETTAKITLQSVLPRQVYKAAKHADRRV